MIADITGFLDCEVGDRTDRKGRSMLRACGTASADRFPILDLLRFLAAVGVVLYHMTYQPEYLGGDVNGHFPLVQAISRFGFLGVELFFLISGFVILWSAHGRSATVYVASRVSRLLPSLWTGVALTTLVLTLVGSKFAIHDAKTLIANMTMAAGYLGLPYVDGVYWTLAVEIKFYVLVYWLVALGQVRRIQYWLFAWLVGLAVTYTTYAPGWLKAVLIFPYGSYFVGGCFCFLMWREGATRIRFLGVLGSLFLSLLCVSNAVSGFVHRPDSFVVFVSVVVVCLFYAVFVLIALRRLELPDSPYWTQLGALTYPLYLLHNRIGRAVGEWILEFGGMWVALAAAILVPIAFAALVARTVERHVCPWLRRAFVGYAARAGLRI